jgi:multiple sugar transport system permease protein
VESTSDNVISRNEIKRRENILRVIVYAISVGLALLTLYPFVMMLVDFTGFKINNPARVLKIIPQRGKEFAEFFKSRTVKGFINSVIVTSCSTILNVYFSAMTAYSITGYTWKLKKVFSNFIVALMMIPNVVAMSGFIQLVYNFGLINNLAILILPSIATPISVVFMRLYLEAAFSMELVYSARIDGAGEFKIFNKIVLPIMKPAIATQAIFAVVSSWTDMFLPMVILTEPEKQTLPIAMVLNLAMGEGTIPVFVSEIPIIVIYLLLARHIVEGVQLGSVKL